MKMMKNKLPIGFMDSGLGGLSVLKEALKLMPHENFIYYGDSRNAPYGTRPPEQIRDLAFAAADRLIEYGIKGLVVACNTATGAAIEQLRQRHPELIIVGIEPAIKPAAARSRGGRILVMATPMTIRQEKFRTLLADYSDKAEIVPVPCAGLMEFVEHGDLDGEFLGAYFKEHIMPYITENTETIVLGCTHYPFLRPYLRMLVDNDKIAIIDGSCGTAREMRRRLARAGLLNDESNTQNVVIQNSAESSEFIELSRKLLRLPIE